ncbi:MAG: extracellular solute-binding protein [Nitriliruptorales bacterium]|nr:extracellular solute-binding protein [Nitriliruptorales bacterium]
MRSILVLSAAVAMVATGCGASDGGSTEEITLRLLMADDWATTSIIADAVRDFEATHPNVRVDVEGQPFSQTISDAEVAIAEGNPHDVVQWHAFAAGARGVAEPVDDLWEQFLDVDEFIPGALEDVTWAGVKYGVPLDTNALILVLNRDALEAADIDPSALDSYEGLRAAVEQVTSADRRGMTIAASGWVTYGWIRANGGEVIEVDDDGNVTFLLDDPRTVEALTFLQEMIVDEVAHPPYARGFQQDLVAQFLAGNALIHPSGSWDYALAGQQPSDFNVALEPMPANGPNAGTVLGGSSMFIPKGSEHRELAFELMVHLIDDKYMLRQAQEHGRLPSRRSLFDDPFFSDPAYQMVAQELERASVMRLIAYPAADEAWAQALDDIFQGRETAADALATAQRRAEEALASP